MKKVVMEVHTSNKPLRAGFGTMGYTPSVQNVTALLEDKLTALKVSNWRIINDHGLLYVHGEFTRKALIEITGSLDILGIRNYFKVVKKF